MRVSKEETEERLNTASAVDNLIKFILNTLEIAAQKQYVKGLLNVTKIAIFERIFANVWFLFCKEW